MAEEIFVLDRKVRLLQPENGFRTSLDTVMLAACCPASAGDVVLDLGCGVGGASLCLARRVPGVTIQGVDIQTANIALAQENAVLNQAHAHYLCHDIKTFVLEIQKRADHVICNPPFLDAGTYTISPNENKAASLGHLDEDIDIKDWIDCAFRCLKPYGSLTLIHRADYVDKIVQGLGKKFGQVEIFPLWPRQGAAAKRVVIRALKDRRSPAIMHAGLILHEADGAYTDAAEAVLRQGLRLF